MIANMKALCLTLTLMASTSLAQTQPGPVCGPYEAMKETLGDSFGETTVGVGLSAQGNVISVFANLETGTFTLVVTDVTMQTCIAVSGSSYEVVTEVLPPKGEDM